MQPSDKPIAPTNTFLDPLNYDFGQTLVTENLAIGTSAGAKKPYMERSSNFSSNSVVLTDFNRRSIFKDGTQEQALSFRGRIFS